MQVVERIDRSGAGQEAGPEVARSGSPPGAFDAPRGRDEVIEALVASATQLFARRGIEGASVREVASCAGVNHALVFRHFGSKARLARTVLDRLLDDLLEPFQGAGLGPEVLATMGERAGERQDLVKLLTRAVLDGEVDFLSDREFPELDALVSAMERAAAAGRIGPAVPPRLMLLIILSGALGWALMDPVLAESVGTPGATPKRRRELARASFMQLLGFRAPGPSLLSDAEERRARVSPEPPERVRVPEAVPASAVAAGPPRGRDQVVQALLASAMELFAQRGPNAVSVREIAAHAGVNHALVFRHFGSKDGLTQAVWDRVVEDLSGRVVGAPDYPSVRALTEAIAENETIWKLSARALLDGGAETMAAVRYHFIDVMVWFAQEGQRTGVLAGGIHPRLLVAMVMATGLGFLVFHPVLRPLLGMPSRDPAGARAELREAIAGLLGLQGAREQA